MEKRKWELEETEEISRRREVEVDKGKGGSRKGEGGSRGEGRK